jgi:N-succinyldiaminopimelate aminotransferase
MVLNGTREGLFNAVVALCPETKAGKRPVVLMPNPFYQVYAVAALTVGAEPVYVPPPPPPAFCPITAACPRTCWTAPRLPIICSPRTRRGPSPRPIIWPIC